MRLSPALPHQLTFDQKTRSFCKKNIQQSSLAFCLTCLESFYLPACWIRSYQRTSQSFWSWRSWSARGRWSRSPAASPSSESWNWIKFWMWLKAQIVKNCASKGHLNWIRSNHRGFLECVRAWISIANWDYWKTAVLRWKNACAIGGNNFKIFWEQEVKFV